MRRSDGGLTRYAGQLIIQLENDPIILDGVLRLAEKHPGSVVVQLDQKIIFEFYMAIRRMSSMNPEGLAELLTNFNQHFSQNMASTVPHNASVWWDVD